MCVILIRSVILYVLVIFAVRLMGKRQLGELQPSELVITILVSNIATLPIEDVNIPIIVGVTPILSLVCFEVMVSWINLRLPELRRLISGSPKIIIRNGCIERDIMGCGSSAGRRRMMPEGRSPGSRSGKKGPGR